MGVTTGAGTQAGNGAGAQGRAATRRPDRGEVADLEGQPRTGRTENVWRLAELSTSIIDQAVAQGVPFNREYGGLLATRSFGGVLVERTFYCRGQTGQQLLLGAYGALSRQIRSGQVQMNSRHEMLDIVIADGRARGVVARDL